MNVRGAKDAVMHFCVGDRCAEEVARADRRFHRLTHPHFRFIGHDGNRIFRFFVLFDTKIDAPEVE